MAQSTLTIRRQIKSIGNTRKVTKAMELVSAAKMRKAHLAVSATRPYASFAHDLLFHLAKRSEKRLHPLLEEQPHAKKICIVAIGSNRGLCGSFNQAVALMARERERLANEQGKQCEMVTVGRRVRETLARYGRTIVADFVKKDITTSSESILPLVHFLISEYEKGSYARVELVTTMCISSIRQLPQFQTLIPCSLLQPKGSAPRDFSQYLFEPSAERVLSFVIPRIIETQIYTALLESEASEHSMRMLAMHNASDAASDLLFSLQMNYNQVRQARITQEIAEITAPAHRI